MSDTVSDPEPDPDEEPAEAVAAPLVEPDEGWMPDDEGAVVASEAHGEVGPLASEEAAVHVVREDLAPGVTWDAGPGYVDDDDPS